MEIGILRIQLSTVHKASRSAGKATRFEIHIQKIHKVLTDENSQLAGLFDPKLISVGINAT